MRILRLPVCELLCSVFTPLARHTLDVGFILPLYIPALVFRQVFGNIATMCGDGGLRT